MKLDLSPVRSSYVAPDFTGDPRGPIDPHLQKRLQRPMILGGLVIAFMVVGLIVWASFSSLSTGITAQGEVRVEANRKTIRHKEYGSVRQILVREGEHVRAGQTLITFNDVEARAAFDVMQNQYDSLVAQAARFSAEAANRTTLEFPADLTARMSDPRVAGLIRDQQVLFTTRLQLFQSQTSVLAQRLDQIESQISGQQIQVRSMDEQIRLTNDEMAGYQTLYDKGFAPKPLILRYQRSVADLQGRKGSLESDIARLHQQLGETRMQVAATRDTRTSQAAEGLRDAQSKIADTLPRLAATREALAGTVVTAPVDGYVFNLTQFTVGGVTAPGEVLMDVVPANTPIIIAAMVPPQDIDKVRLGMEARVKFTGLNQRWVRPLPAKVIMVAPDKTVNKDGTQAFYRADLSIDPKELLQLKKNVTISPGMPAQVMIVSGHKSVMTSLIAPIVDTLHDALHDQ